MKKILIYIFAIFFAVSCAEDKGNYDYKDLNVITQNELKEEYSIERYSVLSIPCPELNFKLGEIKDLSYEWVVDAKVVSTDKDLNEEITAELGKRTAYLIVTDNATKLKYHFKFLVNVITNYKNGIHFLIEKSNGEASLTFLRRDKENQPFTEDVYAYENEGLGVLGKNPTQVMFNYSGSSSQTSYLYVTCKEGDNKIVKINKETMKLVQIMNENTITGEKPTSFVPDFITGMTAVMVVANDRLYGYDFMSSKILYRGSRGDYKLAPMTYTVPTYVYMFWFGYDDLKQQLLTLTNDALAGDDTFAFDRAIPIQGDATTGYTLKASGQTDKAVVGEMGDRTIFNLAMYNKTTKEIAFYNHTNDFNYDENWQPIISNTIEFVSKHAGIADDKSIYLYASSRYWYIATGNKLYKKFYADNDFELIWTSTTGDITALSSNGAYGHSQVAETEIYVTTYNPTSSNAKKSSFYVIDTDEIVTESYEYKLDKCVSLTYVK